MLKVRTAVLAAMLVLAGAGLTACGGEDRWCERDATDTKVSDSYCQQGVAGYEWEPDSDGKTKGKSKKKKR